MMWYWLWYHPVPTVDTTHSTADIERNAARNSIFRNLLPSLRVRVRHRCQLPKPMCWVQVLGKTQFVQLAPGVGPLSQ